MSEPAPEAPEAALYALADLVVKSVVPLPAPAAEGLESVDVNVIEGPVPQVAAVSRPESRLQVGGEEQDLVLRWRDVTAMRVVTGRSITLDRARGVDRESVAPLVLGVGLGLVLHQRGRLVLHGSAVALPAGAVAFVGLKGAGKSTAAGALVRRGHPILTDDALPVDVAAGGRPLAWPGPAPLKLWPESASALGRSPRGLPRLHPRASKRVVTDLPTSVRPAPLVAIYVLDVADATLVESIEGAAAVIELMRHAYAPRFFPPAGATPAHFERSAALARAVPLFRLARPAGLDRLDDFARLVEEHAASLAGA